MLILENKGMKGVIIIEQEVYLCLSRNVIVDNASVKVEQLGSVLCKDKNLQRKVGQVTVFHMKPKEKEPVVVSVMKVMDAILANYKELSIQTIGETDTIVSFRKGEGWKGWQVIKAALASFVLFFGAGFSIMAFHTDIGLQDMFGRLYRQLTGTKGNNFTILEISYSIGICIGIVVFFNHLGKKKVTSDPTPIQVQMRSYEKDIDQVFIEETGRKGTKLDVK